LPAPFGPSSTTTSPGRIENATPPRTSSDSNRIRRFSNRITLGQHVLERARQRERSFTAIGDTTNVAARLQAAANAQTPMHVLERKERSLLAYSPERIKTLETPPQSLSSARRRT
jgi:hypothetical protein